MKKRTYKIMALMLAAAIAVQSPLSVNAMDFEFEEEVILRGTGAAPVSKQQIEPQQENIITGTGVSKETPVQHTFQDIKNQLDQVESYLKTHVTDPVVDTIAGEWSVLAMARYGVLPEGTKTNYLSNLYQTLDERKGILSENSYTDYSRVVLALTAIGVYPGDVNGYNMLYPLADFDNVIWQGVNGPIFALIAFDSHNYEIPDLTQEDLDKGMVQTTRQGLIDYILSQQLEDGGWTLFGKVSDVDMTGMAIQALAPYYADQPSVKEAVDKALATLSQLQDASGGFSSWGVSNVESTVQTIIALSALDVNLLSDEQFVKNGNSIIDNLLTFQLADGSFKHTSKQDEMDAMSTDQGAMALTAYYRVSNGQNSLYNMTDVAIDMGEENETEEAIKAFREKLDALPKEVYIKDQQQVYALLSELDQMKAFEEKETFRGSLQEKLDQIEVQKKEVEELDKDIWEQIDPLHITMEDAKTVQSLMERYAKIPEANKEYVENREDLLKADETIKNLQNESVIDKIIRGTKEAVEKVQENVTAKKPAAVSKKKKTNTSKKKTTIEAEVKDNIVAKTEVEKVKGKEQNLQMKGKMSDETEYTLTLNGKDVKDVKDINIGLKRESEYDDEIRKLAKDPAILCFAQEEDFPGVIQAEVSVEKEDGEYLLLYYNPEEQKAEYLQKVEIKDRQTKFLIEKGGTYFIDKKVSTKSLKEEAEETKEADAYIDNTMDDAVLEGTKKPIPKMVYIGIGIGVIAVAAGVWSSVKRRKRNQEGKNDEK